jgi:hypothetical protein
MSQRALTKGEIELAQSVFGTSMDYSQITMYNRKISRLQPDNFNAAPDGNLYMIKNYCEDYSKAPVEDQAALLHELTHVWQRQNNTMNLKAAFVKETLKAKFNYRATNKYMLEPGKDFNKYGFEQQAGIIEDYHLVSHGKAPLYNQAKHFVVEEYMATLKNVLADPAYARREKKSGFFRRF